MNVHDEDYDDHDDVDDDVHHDYAGGREICTKRPHKYALKYAGISTEYAKKICRKYVIFPEAGHIWTCSSDTIGKSFQAIGPC